MSLGMPIISIFLGIVIRINFGDHNPPHLHAAYGDAEALKDSWMNEIKMVRARRVKALQGHRLEIVFDDDTMGVLDLSEFVQLGPVTEPLRDPDFFGRVFIELGIPTWPNGCDIDAINAWMKLKAAGELRPAESLSFDAVQTF